MAEEVGRLHDADLSTLSRYEDDGARVVVATWSSDGSPVLPAGPRGTMAGRSVATMVFETRQPARMTDHGPDLGHVPSPLLAAGLRCSIAVPILVERRLWGAMCLGSMHHEFPEDTEARLADFTELVATAIANTEARLQLPRLCRRTRSVAPGRDVRCHRRPPRRGLRRRVRRGRSPARHRYCHAEPLRRRREHDDHRHLGPRRRRRDYRGAIRTRSRVGVGSRSGNGTGGACRPGSMRNRAGARDPFGCRCAHHGRGRHLGRARGRVGRSAACGRRRIAARRVCRPRLNHDR